MLYCQILLLEENKISFKTTKKKKNYRRKKPQNGSQPNSTLDWYSDLPKAINAAKSSSVGTSPPT